MKTSTPPTPKPPAVDKDSSESSPARKVLRSGSGTFPAASSATKAPATTSATNTFDDDQFSCIVGETFGPLILQNLIATKWDRKVEALKNVTDILKRKLVQPSQLATQAERQQINGNNSACFRAACMVLERSACDKILPVLLASHELLLGVFQQAGSIIPEEELVKSLDALLTHILPKIGDSNIRLHDSAKATVIFAAGLRYYRVQVVLEQLQGLISDKSRGHMRAKQISGVVDTVCSLVEHFPGTTSSSWNPQVWTMEQISPFITSGLDDVVGPRTRTGAVRLAGAAFSKLGREAMNPLLESLRPAVRNLLLQKFDELDKSPNADPEIEEVPEVEVVVTKPSAVGSAKPPLPKPPLAKSTAKSVAESKQIVKTPQIPKPTESDPCNIQAPALPRAPMGPSPRQKRFTPNSPSHKIFTPMSPRHFAPQPKWKSQLCAEEEDIMDQILEETGLVFGKGEKLTVGLEEEIDNLGLGGMAIECC